MALRHFATQFVLEQVLAIVLDQQQQLSTTDLERGCSRVKRVSIPSRSVDIRDFATHFVAEQIVAIVLGQQQHRAPKPVDASLPPPAANEESRDTEEVGLLQGGESTSSGIADAEEELQVVEEDGQRVFVPQWTRLVETVASEIIAAAQTRIIARCTATALARQEAEHEAREEEVTSGLIVALVVETVASEIMAVALGKVVASCATTTALANKAEQDEDDGKGEDVVVVVQTAPSTKPPVSRRQLIHQVAKATSVELLSLVMQNVAASRKEEAVEVLTTADRTDCDHILHNSNNEEQELDSCPRRALEVSSANARNRSAIPEDLASAQPVALSVPMKTEVDSEQPFEPRQVPPSAESHLGLESRRQQQPSASASSSPDVVDLGSLCGHAAQTFVHDLLIEATESHRAHQYHPSTLGATAPPSAVNQQPSTMAHEPPPSSGGANRKSPNISKRNLVQKHTATAAIRPPAICPTLSQSMLPSAPSEAFPSLPESMESTKTHTKRKKDERPKHRPHQKSKAITTTLKSTLPAVSLEDYAFNKEETSRSSSSPLSSPRQAQESNRPRRNLIDDFQTKKHPRTHHPHPRRHPHHIDSAAIQTETSYSRDSPRADAIAEMQKASPRAAGERGGGSTTPLLLLPLTKPVLPPTASSSSSTTAITSSSSSSSSSAKPSCSPPPASPSRKIKEKPVKSPTKMRSGYCHQCVLEGRSCKINDCLKHQLLR